jgi:MFS family permease
MWTRRLHQAVWGIILIATAYVRSYPALIALRVLLGFMEAPIIPGAYLMLSMFYTRQSVDFEACKGRKALIALQRTSTAHRLHMY